MARVCHHQVSSNEPACHESPTDCLSIVGLFASTSELESSYVTLDATLVFSLILMVMGAFYGWIVFFMVLSPDDDKKKKNKRRS